LDDLGQVLDDLGGVLDDLRNLLDDLSTNPVYCLVNFKSHIPKPQPQHGRAANKGKTLATQRKGSKQREDEESKN